MPLGSFLSAIGSSHDIPLYVVGMWEMMGYAECRSTGDFVLILDYYEFEVFAILQI